MSRRMNWERARLHGRPTTDFRHEQEHLDRAERWLKARQRRERRSRAERPRVQPVPSPIYRAASTGPDGLGCKVEIVELSAAVRYRKVFAFLQMKAPDLVPIERWRQCVTDASRFLARWGLEAERLGWDSRDLFGLVPVPAKPHPSFNRMARLDQMGLCWVLLGRRVTALTETSATIENEATGSRTTFCKGQR